MCVLWWYCSIFPCSQPAHPGPPEGCAAFTFHFPHLEGSFSSLCSCFLLDFSPAGAGVLRTEGFVLMGSTAMHEGKYKLVLTALISAQLKLPEESGVKEKHFLSPAWQSCCFFPLVAALPGWGVELPRAAASGNALPEPGVIHKRVRPVGGECLPCRSCAVTH